MGEIYKFTCPQCGYSAEVSGDVDCGYISVTTTILCKECTTLYDVEIGKALGDKEPFKDPACPRGRQHTVLKRIQTLCKRRRPFCSEGSSGDLCSHTFSLSFKPKFSTYNKVILNSKPSPSGDPQRFTGKVRGVVERLLFPFPFSQLVCPVQLDPYHC